MRVAIVNRFFRRQGAVPAVARGWADHLEKAGHRVVVFASDVRPDQSTPARTYVRVRLGRVKWFDLGGLAFAARLVGALAARGRKLPDVALSMDSTAYLGLWIAWRLWGLRPVLFPQGWIYSPGRAEGYPRSVAWLYKASACFSARFAPMIGCISREIYEGLQKLGAAEDRLWHAPNCVDLERWRPFECARSRDDSAPELLFVGRFSPQKGLRYLLEAFARVVARHPEARLKLLGGAEDDDGPYHSLVRGLGVERAVEFGGLVPQDALGAFYSAADALVMPSISEGHALAPLECLACGTPVIASDIPGLRETVQHEVNGLLVPPADPEALAEAICRVVEEPGLLERLSRAARPSVEPFAWDRRVAELEEVCARLGVRVAAVARGQRPG